MQGNPAIIELLNDVLTAELTAINQYFVHAKMQANWGYEHLAAATRDESIDEMKHAEKIVERILYLDGTPNLQRLGALRVGETVPEQLRLDLALETEAIPRLNEGIAAVVAGGDGRGDAGVEPGDGLQLEVEVQAELLGHGLTHHEGAEALQVGGALEEEDPLDDPLGVLHLVDGLVAGGVGEVLVAPVGLHLGVDEVLVDRRELGGQHLVEQLDDLAVALHGRPPTAGGRRRSGGRLLGDLGGGSHGHEQRLDRRVAAAAPGASAAPGGDVLDVEGSGDDLVGDATVVHGEAVAHLHRGSMPGPFPVLSSKPNNGPSAWRRPVLPTHRGPVVGSASGIQAESPR